MHGAQESSFLQATVERTPRGNTGKLAPDPSSEVVDDSLREQQILHRLAARDSRAMVDLYQLYSTPLFSYAMKCLRDEADAEEALQDAFIKIWNQAGDFDPARSRPFTWCYMILRGLCFDRLRKRSAQKRRGQKIPLDDVNPKGTGQTEVIRRLIFHEHVAQIRTALRTLKPLERTYIEMAVFGEITHSEIAERVDEPLGTVKTRIRRGMIKLRKALRGMVDD